VLINLRHFICIAYDHG